MDDNGKFEVIDLEAERQKPVQVLVEMLEGMLSEAKKGVIEGAIIVSFRPSGGISRNSAGKFTCEQLIMAAALIHDEGMNDFYSGAEAYNPEAEPDLDLS